MWALNWEMIKGIQGLNLKAVLGNTGNSRECLRLIDEIEQFHLHDVLGKWTAQGALPNFDSGRHWLRCGLPILQAPHGPFRCGARGAFHIS